METLEQGVKSVKFSRINRSGAFIVNFEEISNIFLVLPLLL